MTQEERNAKWDKLINPQQPIPQDINKFIQDKANEKYGTGERLMQMKMWHGKIGFIAGAQLLLPQLQQLREQIEQQKSQIEELKKENGRTETDLRCAKLAFEKQAAEIESLKIALSETKALNNAYAEKIERQNKRIESLEQEIDGEEAISRDRNLALQQSLDEIESLKQEILRLKEQHNKWAKIYNDRLDNQP